MSAVARHALVVVVDALRADRVGATDDRGDSLTPTIDEIGEEGARFTRAFTAINTTEASVTSLHSGEYPRSTVYRHAYRVSDRERRRVAATPLLPEVLAESGFRTIAVAPALGRWNRRGFEEFVGPDSSSAWLKRLYWRLKPRFPRFANAARALLGGTGSRGDSNADDGVTVQDIRRLTSSFSSARTYGFVRLVDTHLPYEADEDRIESLLDRRDYPTGDLEPIFDAAPAGGFLETSVRPMLTDRDFSVGLPRLCARYDACVMTADSKIARLREELQRLGEWDQTLLMICADHGESLTEHGIYADHHGLYEPTLRVPLIVRSPRTVGSTHEDLVQVPDIGPTVADGLGVSESLGSYGHSLAPAWRSDAHVGRDVILAEENWAQRRFAVRGERFKLIGYEPDDSLPDNGLQCRYCERYHDDPPVLFDLSVDASESRDVIEEYSGIAEDLESKYRRILEELPESGERSPRNYDDEAAVLSRLEDLGYR